MSKAIQNRLKNELSKLVKEPICNSEIALENEEDIRIWVVVMQGPSDSPYSEGYFKLRFVFPENYPFKPPEVKFLTTMYHPNIKQDTGEICLDVFSSSWTPTQKVSEILEKIASILKSPSSTSPLEPEIANLLQNKPKEFEKNAKEYTLKYATK